MLRSSVYGKFRLTQDKEIGCEILSSQQVQQMWAVQADMILTYFAKKAVELLCNRINGDS